MFDIFSADFRTHMFSFGHDASPSNKAHVCFCEFVVIGTTLSLVVYECPVFLCHHL